MDLHYYKRPGTSGITGQFYETKLICLLLFILTKDETVEEFYLASNMDDIGAFDDICINIKVKGRKRNLLLLIQAKHKESDKGRLIIPENELNKWANSINKIKDKFASENDDNPFFTGDLKDTDYYLILYTNAEYKFRKSSSNKNFEGRLATQLNGWLSTGKTGALPNYTSKDEEDIAEILLKDELKILAERFATFLQKTDLTNIMNDPFISKYHVVLQKKVVSLSEVKSKKGSPDIYWRCMTFRNDFFTTTDKHISIFRDVLYTEILKRQDKQPYFSSQHARLTLALILMDIKFKNEEYVFIKKKFSALTSRDAKAIAAMTILIPLQVKVPLTFGNVDLVVRSEGRIKMMADYINELCKKPRIEGLDEIITEPINQSRLSLNGGLGSAIGNVLDYDDQKRLKFADNTKLRGNAIAFMSKLEIGDETKLKKYRFPVEAAKLPTLTLDCTDIAKEFLDKFLIYSQQSNQGNIQDILEKYIQNCYSSAQTPTLNYKTVFEGYHSLILTWWMSSQGQYLTKSSDMCQQAIAASESQMFALQTTFCTDKINYLDLRYKEYSIKLIKNLINSLENPSKSVITTETTYLTMSKVIQCLKSNYAIIDLDAYCTVSLTPDRLSILNAELSKTNKIIIVVCEYLHNMMNSDAWLHLAKATEHKKVIFIVNNELHNNLQQNIPNIIGKIHDEPEFTELESDSEHSVLHKARIIFQGEKIFLSLLVKENIIPSKLIKGVLFDKIVNRQIISVGQQLKDAKYDKIKHLYINRTISKEISDESVDTDESAGEISDKKDNSENKKKKIYYLQDLTDISQNLVLIIAKPGMGKSTLLTHVSLMQLYNQVERSRYLNTEFSRNYLKSKHEFYWIVRINLLDYSKVFAEWQKNEAVPEGLETLEFLCRVVLNNQKKSISLQQASDGVHLSVLEEDNWIDFELNLFLKFYNTGNVVFLFDGFDEICPGYKHNVIQFFDEIKKNLGKNKMWVTSRPYTDLLPDLIKVFGDPYHLEHVSYRAQEYYLSKFWRENINFRKLTDDQVKNTINIMSDYYINSKCFYIFNSFLEYLQRHISQDTSDSYDSDESNLTEPNQAEKLTGTPLILFLTANYCVNLLNDTLHTTNQSSFSDINIYEMFIKTKFKNILYEEKDDTDLTIQSNLTKYETDRKRCMKRHKMMGAYAILGNPIGSRQEIYFEEFKDLKPIKDENKLIKFKEMIASIRKGEEKTGLITHVTADDIPVFIHRTFAEYFAAEFICDIFIDKSIELRVKRLLYTTLMETPSYGVKHWILKKTGGNSLFNNVTQEYIPYVYKGPIRKMLPNRQFIRLMSATPEDFEREYYNDETTNFFAKHVLFSDEEDDVIDKHIRNTIDGIIATMKPHLREHFVNKVETK